jgi:hypothetical protein
MNVCVQVCVGVFEYMHVWVQVCVRMCVCECVCYQRYDVRRGGMGLYDYHRSSLDISLNRSFLIVSHLFLLLLSNYFNYFHNSLLCKPVRPHTMMLQ